MPDAAPDDLDLLWQRVRSELQSALPRTTVELWFEPLRPLSARGSALLVTAPRSVRAWVERRYGGTLLDAVRRHTAEISALEFVDPADAPATPGEPEDHAPRSLEPHPAHTFERFVIGPGNRLAHAAALAVAELPGEAYNPLFLHGPPGLGKSHLLGAIHEYMGRNHPALTVHQTTAERFTSEFVTALRHNGPDAFKRRYREIDALLIDDVQFLEGKERTADEFFHTFNALHGAGKQIVLSSDRPPEALSGLADRLRDRFAWGLTVELESPDLRTRIAVLWRLAGDRAGELPDPTVLTEIASRVPGNVRLLEGAMTRVLALSSVLREPLDTAIVARALGGPDARPSTSARDLTLERIQETVASVHGLSRAELVSRARSPRIARARQIAMYVARELTPLSLADIARGFDRDHTTVLHAIRTVAERLEPGSEVQAAIHRVHVALGTVAGGPADGSPRGGSSDRDPQR